MKKSRKFFKPAGLPRALLECFFLGILLMGSLQWTSQQVEDFHLSNGLLFLSGFLAFWMMLRLRRPEGRFLQKLALEFAYGLVLALLMGMILPLILNWIGLSPPQENANRFTHSLWRLFSAPLYWGFRLGKYFWLWWEIKRRRHLAWNLMHIQLSLGALVAMILILIGGISIFSFAQTNYPYDSASAFVNLILRLVQTLLPYLGITLLIALGTLIILLPPAALIAYSSVRRFTQRLDDLTKAAGELRQGHYSARTTVRGEDEIAQLQKDFNAMAGELEQTLAALEKERDKVASLLEARRQLLANVSHELRTPVATARSYLEPITTGPQEIPPQIRQDLDIIQKELNHLSRLIDDLFTLSSAEVGALGISPKSVDVNTIVQRMANTFKPLAWRTGRVEIVVETPDQPLTIILDPDRLEQVLANLIRNAIRHTPPGGIIALRTDTNNDTVDIHVQDTGEGIPPEELPLIWNRFYRGSQPGTAQARGAGLGLALVKELVQAMGGEVDVRSQPGEGSDFIIRFQASQGDTIETTSL
jgi:signal transduction histidine kinase